MREPNITHHIINLTLILNINNQKNPPKNPKRKSQKAKRKIRVPEAKRRNSTRREIKTSASALERLTHKRSE